MVVGVSKTMEDESDTSSASTMQSIARSLIAQKADIEKEMDAIAAELNCDSFSCIGLKQPLIDKDGFPVSGIDVHQVRILRNRFAILSTDLEQVLRKIEVSINEIHEHARNTGNIQSGSRGRLVPFGRVDTVVSGSPADDAGLLVGDKILKFGGLCTVSDSSVKHCYDGIPESITGIPDGDYIDIYVTRLERDSTDILVRIRPREGRVGCLIKPL